jgi:hypothetical protein
LFCVPVPLLFRLPPPPSGVPSGEIKKDMKFSRVLPLSNFVLPRFKCVGKKRARLGVVAWIIIIKALHIYSLFKAMFVYFVGKNGCFWHKNAADMG